MYLVNLSKIIANVRQNKALDEQGLAKEATSPNFSHAKLLSFALL